MCSFCINSCVNLLAAKDQCLFLCLLSSTDPKELGEIYKLALKRIKLSSQRGGAQHQLFQGWPLPPLIPPIWHPL